MIDPRSKKINPESSCTLIALPDTEEQFYESQKRGGMCANLSFGAYWDHQHESDPAFRDGHIEKYIQYEDRRKEFLALKKAGCNIILGATQADVDKALSEYLINGQYLCIIGHNDKKLRALELNDGFLAIDSFIDKIPHDANGILDLVSCEASDFKDDIKDKAPFCWVITSDLLLTTSGWLLFHSHFLRFLQQKPSIFEDLWRRTVATVNEAGSDMSLVKEELAIFLHEVLQTSHMGDADKKPPSSLQSRFEGLSEKLAQVSSNPPKQPSMQPLGVVLLIVFVVAILFALSIVLLSESEHLEIVTVGGGTIFSLLTGLALLIARGHFQQRLAYEQGIVQYEREQAIIQLIRSIVHKNMSAEDIVAVVSACRDITKGKN